MRTRFIAQRRTAQDPGARVMATRVLFAALICIVASASAEYARAHASAARNGDAATYWKCPAGYNLELNGVTLVRCRKPANTEYKPLVECSPSDFAGGWQRVIRDGEEACAKRLAEQIDHPSIPTHL